MSSQLLAHKGVHYFSPQQAVQQSGQLICGEVSTDFGLCYAAMLDGVLCYLALSAVESEIAAPLKKRWPKTQHQWVARNNPNLSTAVDAVLAKKSVPLILVGSGFQQQIWRTLLEIPAGSVISYQALAKQAQKPKAIRATASAVANNLIAVAVPCHRVIRSSGDIGQYRWGVENKRKLLREEGCAL